MKRLLRLGPLASRTMSTSSPLGATAPKAAETDQQAEATANTSGVTSESIEKTLKDKVAAQYVDIEDMSGMSVPCIDDGEFVA